jgi:hypothetical protein
VARTNGILVVTTLLGIATSIWLYSENRALKEQVSEHAATAAAAADPWAQHPAGGESHARTGAVNLPRAARPSVPDAPEVPFNLSWLDRRAHRQKELSALFGRGATESEADYRARVVPLVKAGLSQPRQHAEEMRKSAEEKAHVTPAQSQQLDQVFRGVFGDAVTYANKAITDGTVSPYEQNMASLLEFGGGLGAMLQDANTQIGRILSPEQMRAMTSSGFEWGQYLGVEIPWDDVTPPNSSKLAMFCSYGDTVPSVIALLA